MGNKEAAGLLAEILEEEKAANEGLTELARAGCNEEALEEDEDSAPPKPAGKKAVAPSPAAANQKRTKVNA